MSIFALPKLRIVFKSGSLTSRNFKRRFIDTNNVLLLSKLPNFTLGVNNI